MLDSRHETPFQTLPIDDPEVVAILALLNEANNEARIAHEEQQLAVKEGSTQKANEAFKQARAADELYLQYYDWLLHHTDAYIVYAHEKRACVLVERGQ